MAIEHDRRDRVVAIEDELEHRADVRHLVRRQRRLGEHPRKAAGLQQAIALAQRQVERLGQDQQRGAAVGCALAGLDEADVPRREPGMFGEIDLVFLRPRVVRRSCSRRPCHGVVFPTVGTRFESMPLSYRRGASSDLITSEVIAARPADREDGPMNARRILQLNALTTAISAAAMLVARPLLNPLFWIQLAAAGSMWPTIVFIAYAAALLLVARSFAGLRG